VAWVFSDDGVEITQRETTAFAEWDEFDSWRRVGAYYLLHTTPARYVVLPERAIAVERRTDFEALLAAHLKTHP
jgi:hypothetical protein